MKQYIGHVRVKKYGTKVRSPAISKKIKDIYLDCDADVLLLIVEQVGGIACHTGRHNCFFQKLQDDQWIIAAPIIKEPKEIYNK